MKISKIKTIAANLDQGAWVVDIPGLEGLALKVRGGNNPDARRLRQKLVQEVPAEDRKGGLSDADAARINVEVIVGAVLVDWNLTDDDGAALPITKDLLRDLPPLVEGVAYASQVVGTEGQASLESATKN